MIQEPRGLPLLTERLRIRMPTVDDTPGFHTLYSDPRVMKYLSTDPSKSLEETCERVERLIKWQQEWGYTVWLVEHRLTGEFVGHCGLLQMARKGPEVEVAYAVVPAQQGRGYATEAARTVLAYGLEVLGISPIYAVCLPENNGSEKVMEKIGMKWLERSNRFYDRELTIYQA
ncbi:GNAT family N-acetyltransferase [bacterium]|nr:GNAT family N-acetyltransferase [bacterium]